MKGLVMLQHEVLQMLTMMVEDKDTYTSGHSKRVAMYASSIAKAMGLDEKEQAIVYEAGLLHDIGKILTPESVLLKPKKYNRNEYNIIKNHSVDGEKMVLFISDFKAYAAIIRGHHERYDGKGYPDGLSGDAIPLFCRIMSVADAFDAMTTNRIYKSKKTIEEALLELKKCSQTQFDPDVIASALDVLPSFKELIHNAQIPKNNIDEERFAHYFKDLLTGMYTADYLNYYLRENKENHAFRCCYVVEIHKMNHYNERFGWKCGDELLKEVALRIKVLFQTSHVFRIFGDDFVVLNPLHVSIDCKEVCYKLGVGFEGIQVCVHHFDLQNERFSNWEDLESCILKQKEEGGNEARYLSIKNNA